MEMHNVIIRNNRLIPESSHKCLLRRCAKWWVCCGSEVDPRIRTRTASGDKVGQTMLCPASVVLPPSSCPSPTIQQARSLVRVPIRVHGNFLAIWWFFWIVGRRVLSLHWVKKEHKCSAAMKEEIEEIPKPDMSQAGKACIYVDFNHAWVGGRKQLITGYYKSETVLTICKLVCLLPEIFK